MRNALLLPLLVLAAGCASPAAPRPAPDVAVDPSAIVRQHTTNACGTAAILNSLRFGSASLRRVYDALPGATPREKVSGATASCGARPSTVVPAQPLYDPVVGMYSEDILAAWNALLAEHGEAPVAGTYADRANGELTWSHLERVHGLLARSLAAGVPPVVSVRSFAARTPAPPAPPAWEGVNAHAVAVTKVPASLSPGRKGFAFEYLDPSLGAVREGYVHVEDVRPFCAVKGSGPTGWTWLEGSPFLLVTLPSEDMGTGGEAWNARTIVTLNYVIGRW